MNTIKTIIIICLLPIYSQAVCLFESNDTYTLYRDSTVGSDVRVHVATFDTKEKAPYNKVNCEHAQMLFQNQLFIKTKFWCEKGRYKE